MSYSQTNLTEDQKKKLAEDLIQAKGSLELLVNNLKGLEDWLKTGYLGTNEELYLNNCYNSSADFNYNISCMLSLYNSLKIKGKKGG